MKSEKKSPRQWRGLRPEDKLGQVIKGWKFLSDGEKLEISYRVVLVPDNGEVWALEPVPLIIGREG